MRSPTTGNELRQLAGSASSIWDRGDDWVDLAGQMSGTARKLTEIGDSSVHRSKGTDKLGELAAETAVDLSDAAVRYRETGKVLRTYADALDVAQSWLRSNKEDVEQAENDYNNAQQWHDDAVASQNSLETVWVWEEDPEQHELNAAATAVSQASAALTTARDHRTAMWQAFDDVFETWSDAYDEAVESIEEAYETAGNNDGFWEGVDALLEVLAVVLIVLTVIALVIGAPLTGLLGAIIFGLSALVFALNALKFAFGRASLSDLALAAVGLLPFGIGKILNRGIPTLSSVVGAGRGSVVAAIRGGLPPVFSTVLTVFPRFHPIRAVSNAWTWLRAPAVARTALPRPGIFVNPLRSTSMGSAETVQIQTFLQTMRRSDWASNPGVQQVIVNTASRLPGIGAQAGNVVTWLGSFTFGVAQASGWNPQIPGLSDMRVG